MYGFTVTISTREKHWTILRFISLDGDPVMYVIIFVGKIETKQ